MNYEPVLLRNIGKKLYKVADYVKEGGYSGLEKALQMKPEEITEEVKKANLRGRGGAGFPAGVKWSFVPKDIYPKYLVCNADESEPGTFKDRVLIEEDPHLLIEGCAISSYAIGANTCYIYIRGEYTKQADILEDAIADAYKEGIIGSKVMDSNFSLDIVVHRGAGAYICGEETGLLESLEGKRGQPRVKPPFPAVVGAFGKPTVINNVETLCCVPFIVSRGAEWFRSIGIDEKNCGPKLYAISGHVEKPGVYEFPMGITFEKLLEEAGGIWQGRKLKAFIPGGASAPVMTADDIGIPMSFDHLAKAGSMLGSAAVIVIDDNTCMVKVAKTIAHFFNHESCGQCTPCREGTNWLEYIIDKVLSGKATEKDIDLLTGVCNQIEGNCLCALGDAAAMSVRSIAIKFKEEFMKYVKKLTLVRE